MSLLAGKRWLTVEESAEYTGTDPEWILGHIKAGALKYVPTAKRKNAAGPGPRRRIIDRLKLDALMERLEVSDQATVIPADAPAKPKPASATGGKERLRDRLAKI